MVSWFRRERFTRLRPPKRREIPDGLWTKCPQCGEILYRPDLEANLKVCRKCNYHFRLTARERISQLLDEGTFEEFDAGLRSTDPLGFCAPGNVYKEKLAEYQKRTGLLDAAVTGKGLLEKLPVVLAVTDSHFLMGSMGAVVGEKITRAAERALELRQPFICVSGSGGGARMHEGMVSLMQMAKTSAAIGRLHEHGILYIVVQTDPTMAGIYASFGTLGDLIIAEPGAMIGFTGRRVIEQTTGQKLPEGFQRAEFQLEHGFVDMIVQRHDLKSTLARVIRHLTA